MLKTLNLNNNPKGMIMENNQEANAQDQGENSTIEEKQSYTKEDLLEQVARLQSKATRLEEESRKYKKNWQELRSDAENKQKQYLEEQGKFKELYETERRKSEDLFKNFVRTKVESMVSGVAQKNGCLDVDALLKLGNAELLQYDETSHNVVGVETFVDEAKKRHPYLFQTHTRPNINTALPNAGHEKAASVNASNYAKLKKEDKANVLAKLLKGK